MVADLDDAAFDFVMELDDPLPRRPIPLASKPRKKVIGLDELLDDHYKSLNKPAESTKHKKKRKYFSSDDEDDAKQAAKEAKVAQVLHDATNKFEELKSEDDAACWNFVVFGKQKQMPSVVLDIGNLTKSFSGNESGLLHPEEIIGESFYERLLVNGWLTKFVWAGGQVESLLFKWVLDLMFYSVKEDVRSSACAFWCDVLASESTIAYKLIPRYPEFKKALDIYGYSWSSLESISYGSTSVQDDSQECGPPQHIRVWIQLLTVCSQQRSKMKHPFLSTLEAEELLAVLISLFLDRRLLGLSTLLNDGILSIVNYLVDDEWDQSCTRIAKYLASRVTRDLNSLRIVECIPGENRQSKLLKSTVAFEILVSRLDKATDIEAILNQLIAINVMEETCNLLNLYIYIGLTENCLLNAPPLKYEKGVYQLWQDFLKKCYRVGTPSDWRSCASKVRNRVAYLSSCVVSSTR